MLLYIFAKKVPSANREVQMNQRIHHFKADFFKALGHPIRLALLNQLRNGERSVNELQTALGADQSTVSQHLAVLRNKQIVDMRKDGTSAYYAVRDPLIFELLDVARAIFNNRLVSTQEMLEQVDQEFSVS